MDNLALVKTAEYVLVAMFGMGFPWAFNWVKRKLQLADKQAQNALYGTALGVSIAVAIATGTLVLPLAAFGQVDFTEPLGTWFPTAVGAVTGLLAVVGDKAAVIIFLAEYVYRQKIKDV